MPFVSQDKQSKYYMISDGYTIAEIVSIIRASVVLFNIMYFLNELMVEISEMLLCRSLY